MSAPRIVLVGPPGAGKSTVAAALADRWQLTVRDTDADVEAVAGKSIADLFVDDGEPYFRALERAAVVSALQSDGVVSLGGGAVLDADTRRDLAGQRVAFLTVSAHAVEGRLGGGKRPLIRNGIDDWERIFAERRPLYDEVSDLTIDTSQRPFDSIAEEVAEWARR